MLDSTTHELLKLVSRKHPSEWEARLASKKLTVSEVKERGYEKAFFSLLWEEVESLGRSSLPYKGSLLRSICKPEKDWEVQGFKYDEIELDRIDTLRHDIIHGRVSRKPIDDIEQILDFMTQTGLYL